MGAAVVAAALLAGCGGGGHKHATTSSSTSASTSTSAPTSPTSPTSATTATAAKVQWHACHFGQCGTLRVPLDYQEPSRGSVSLAVMERPVPQSKGVIVFNPGGPGRS